VKFPRGILFSILALLGPGSAQAGVLPDDRADALYHLYDGGGVQIDGPSVLIRKHVGKSTSLVAGYYVDMISSASIDVITTASPYREERTQWSLGMDYLHGNTTMSVGFVSSVESDYEATNFSFSVSQDMFSDLTTLTLMYALGDDIVGNSGDPTFEEGIDRQIYGIGLTQILTRNMIASVNFETITEEGFLNNPYRSVRYADAGSAIGYSYEPELYPNTRTSNALGMRVKYHLPYRAAIEGEYRFFKDTWDIDGHTVAISYLHPLGPWTFKARLRYHDQTGAHFFRDIFPRSQATNFRGRDKELSPLTSTTFRLAASYDLIGSAAGWGFIKRASVSAAIEFLHIDYHEFKDLSTGAALGSEPLYTLEANIFQLFFSFWY
jgi:hypothetical protein